MKPRYLEKLKKHSGAFVLLLLLPAVVMAEGEKKLYEMSFMEAVKSGRAEKAACFEWMSRARDLHAGVNGESGPSVEGYKKSTREAAPAGSVFFTLEMLAIEASANGQSQEEVSRIVVEKCREYKPRYVINDSDRNGWLDPNPEKKGH